MSFLLINIYVGSTKKHVGTNNLLEGLESYKDIPMIASCWTEK